MGSRVNEVEAMAVRGFGRETSVVIVKMSSLEFIEPATIVRYHSLRARYAKAKSAQTRQRFTDSAESRA